MSDQFDVSVLIPVLNEAPVIRETAAAVQAQDFEGSLEILMIDGGSRDGTPEILEEMAASDPRVRVLHNPRRIQAAALNIGLRHAQGEVIARMDAHTHYPAHHISAGVRRLRRGDVGWVSGPPIPLASGKWSRRIGMALGSRFGSGGADKWRAAPEGTEWELDTGVFGGFWERATLERLGGWDEDWPVNEDAELAGRHLGTGGRIVCLQELAAPYMTRDSLVGLWRQYYGYGKYRVRTSRRHPRSTRPSHLVSAGPALALLTATLCPSRGARAAARGGLALWTLSAALVSARLGGPGRWRDAAALPVVFGTMHFSWGFGFLAGCWRFGPPLPGIAWAARTAARRAGLAARRRWSTASEARGNGQTAT